MSSISFMYSQPSNTLCKYKRDFKTPQCADLYNVTDIEDIPNYS